MASVTVMFSDVRLQVENGYQFCLVRLEKVPESPTSRSYEKQAGKLRKEEVYGPG